jgi:hypothetical protein
MVPPKHRRIYNNRSLVICCHMVVVDSHRKTFRREGPRYGVGASLSEARVPRPRWGVQVVALLPPNVC